MKDSVGRVVGALALAGVATVLVGAGRVPVPASATAPPTWADVARILRARCGDCHYDGGSGPFSLMTFQEAAPRAERVARAVAARHMPPWLPDSDGRTFEGARILSGEEIGVLRDWAEAGAPAGDLASVPPPPEPPSSTWPLGPPDLVVEIPAFTVPPDGQDIYRNLVVPVPVDEDRWVRAVDFRPGDPRVVHHARMMVDHGPSSRERDLEEPGPGFDGMDLSTDAANPPGHFVGWTPGKGLLEPLEGMAWRLTPDTDLVPQLHLRPTGREETVRGKVGLYFADEPPTLHPAVVILSSFMIDIPPGEDDYRVSNAFTLPVPVEVLSVYPHAHYLGKEMTVTAVRPGGGEVELLHIPDWDFDWQDEYRFRRPVSLPAGTTLVMEYSYDNSAANPDNPFDPPRRIVYGSNSTDEMADLILQVLPRSEQDRDVLLQAQARQHDAEDMAYMATMELRRGEAALEEGRHRDAVAHFQEALQYRSDSVGSLVGLARAFLGLGDGTSARFIAERAVQVTGRGHPEALATLAEVHAHLGARDAAVDVAEEALALARARDQDELVRTLRDQLRRYREGGGS